jgi:hypothetical protein
VSVAIELFIQILATYENIYCLTPLAKFRYRLLNLFLQRFIRRKPKQKRIIPCEI